MDYILEPYDKLLQKILDKGQYTENRTGIPSIYLFGEQLEINISSQFPILTKRKLRPLASFAELLWILSGSTNEKELQQIGSKIWFKWSDPLNKENSDFYLKTGFPVGYLGPIYGFQLRNFGGDYFRYIETGELVGGTDQLTRLRNDLKVNPKGRRLLVEYWNPAALHLQRLPPCHTHFQLDVDAEGRLSILFFMRSCDLPVGGPFNLIFYSALCYMLAKDADLKPYKVIQQIGNAHIYINQIEQVREYLSRPESESPTLKLKDQILFGHKIWNTGIFEVENYSPQPKIDIPVAV